MCKHIYTIIITSFHITFVGLKQAVYLSLEEAISRPKKNQQNWRKNKSIYITHACVIRTVNKDVEIAKDERKILK